MTPRRAAALGLGAEGEEAGVVEEGWGTPKAAKSLFKGEGAAHDTAAAADETTQVAGLKTGVLNEVCRTAGVIPSMSGAQPVLSMASCCKLEIFP